MKELLLLKPVNLDKNKPTKILDENLNKLESFDAGYKFHFEVFEYDDFHAAMKEVFAEKDCFMVLGDLTDHGRRLFESDTPAPRRKKSGTPTIEDKIDNVIVLDLDDHKIRAWNPLKPEPAIKRWLRKRKINCDVTWQITSGQKLDTDEARIRLYFTCEKDLTLQERKAWAQSEAIQADGSVFTCSQPIYTAPPIIKGGTDPIKVRTGYIKGTRRSLYLDPPTTEEVKRYGKNIRGDSEWNFEDKTLPDEVKNGSVYRRYFMPLAFHYANKGLNRDEIFAIISTKALQVKSREFEVENTYEYIDDAIQKIEEEKEEEVEDTLLTEKDVKENILEGVPEFPKDTMRKWPEPWPMLWKNFKKVPREVTEPLLVPTVISMMSYFLMSNYVSGMQRRPNMLFLNLTPSTGNKDVNSKNVIEDLDLIFREIGKLKTTPFTGIVSSTSTITADTSFLESFDEEENMFWINTEATRIFHQLDSSGGNSNVAGLSDKLIEVVDGRKISGKKKAGKGQTVREIADPNAQILFYAQPETIEKYITSETVDSGLFGRTMLSIIPTLEFNEDEFSIFLHDDTTQKEIDEEFYLFFMSKEMLFTKTENKKVLKPTKAGLQILHEWSKEFLFPLMKSDEALMKVLKRMGIAAEQLYTIVLGVCRAWDKHQGKEQRKSIDVNLLIPLLEYWANTKVYAIRNFVNTTLDPMAEEIYQILRECLEGKHDKMFMTLKDKQALKNDSLICVSVFNRILRNRPALIRRLEKSGEKRNAVQNALRLIEQMVRHGILIQKERGAKKYVGIVK